MLHTVADKLGKLIVRKSAGISIAEPARFVGVDFDIGIPKIHCANLSASKSRRVLYSRRCHLCTGERRTALLALYTYAEACPSESLPDWIGVHTNLFTFLGGVPKFVVCDNLKAAVTNPDRYDPGLNRTYAEMASHYGTAVLAARPRRPKDKAKVEVAVQIAQRWVLARLRNQRFFWLAS